MPFKPTAHLYDSWWDQSVETFPFRTPWHTTYSRFFFTLIGAPKYLPSFAPDDALRHWTCHATLCNIACKKEEEKKNHFIPFLLTSVILFFNHQSILLSASTTNQQCSVIIHAIKSFFSVPPCWLEDKWIQRVPVLSSVPDWPHIFCGVQSIDAGHYSNCFCIVPCRRALSCFFRPRFCFECA